MLLPVSTLYWSYVFLQLIAPTILAPNPEGFLKHSINSSGTASHTGEHGGNFLHCPMESPDQLQTIPANISLILQTCNTCHINLYLPFPLFMWGLRALGWVLVAVFLASLPAEKCQRTRNKDDLHLLAFEYIVEAYIGYREFKVALIPGWKKEEVL